MAQYPKIERIVSIGSIILAILEVQVGTVPYQETTVWGPLLVAQEWGGRGQQGLGSLWGAALRLQRGGSLKHGCIAGQRVI